VEKGQTVMATHPQLLADRAMGQFRQGQFNAAFKTARAGAKEHPRESFFFNLAGLAQVQGGNPRDAIDWFRKAIRVNPSNVEAQNNLAQTLTSLGETKTALDLIEKFLLKRKDNDVVLYLKAMALNVAGQNAAAKEALDTLLAAYPNDARALNLRGTIRYALGEENEASQDYQASLSLRPNSPDVLANFALLLSRAGRMDDALASAQKSVELAPNYGLGLNRLAMIQNEMGDQTASLATYLRALELAPYDAELLLDTASIATRETAAKIEALTDAALKKEKPSTLSRAYLFLAKAKLALAKGDIAGSDAYFVQGNALHHQNRPFDRARVIREQAQTLALFASKPPEMSDVPPTRPRPIFVLGLPRSGTTLIEQVISAHPDVYGAGELPWMERVARRILEAETPLDDASCRDLRDYYLSNLPRMPDNTTAFVDKMPGNYKRIGFILAGFPDAIILSIRRDPRDVALSMWQTTFGSQGMYFTFDQREMAFELNAYRQYMLAWEQIFPGRIHEIDYETLVGDVSAESRRIADICGLEWVDAMERPHENVKAVRTASITQVRSPVSTKSVGRWKKHAGALKEFIAGLEPTLWPDL
jgi:tetratricopeptide (TPR) repeat protein